MTPAVLQSSSSSRLNAPQIHQLPNGLTIVAEQLPVEAISLNIWLGMGSAVETDAINGMAHFLEHMIFKGTQRLQSGEFERQVEERGAVMNAATSQDYTHYYITTSPQEFAKLAPYQVEVVSNALIPDDAFERERMVVLEEIRRSHDNPRRRTFSEAMKLGFERLPYYRQVLGPAEVVEGLTAEQMRQFHAQWYQPRSMTTAVIGNLPAEELVQIVADGFEEAIAHRPFEVSPLPLTRLNHEPEPSFEGIVRRDMVDDGLQQARLVMMWRVPGIADLEQTYPLDILASILGRGRTARLIRDLREERQLVSRIAVSNLSYYHQGLFYISVELPTENLETVEEAIAQHIADLHNNPATDSELQRVRTLVANRFVFANESPSDRSGLYGFYHVMTGGLDAAIRYPEHIQSVQVNDLKAAAQNFLSPNAYGVLTMRPN
ncbi:M16 family metallopeptidase [Vacuolonema iberomarrocanum]|uniref:M16 family metallopeptidase n=1 Tax=Vacuolonema iberomarrocanum TaxID=3454632 RepID=UPI0019E28FDF|nr:insulinase family protein [filamentous cyanobacterium LEGE 07170]